MTSLPRSTKSATWACAYQDPLGPGISAQPLITVTMPGEAADAHRQNPRCVVLAYIIPQWRDYDLWAKDLPDSAFLHDAHGNRVPAGYESYFVNPDNPTWQNLLAQRVAALVYGTGADNADGIYWDGGSASFPRGLLHPDDPQIQQWEERQADLIATVRRRTTGTPPFLGNGLCDPRADLALQVLDGMLAECAFDAGDLPRSYPTVGSWIAQEDAALRAHAQWPTKTILHLAYGAPADARRRTYDLASWLMSADSAHSFFAFQSWTDTPQPPDPFVAQVRAALGQPAQTFDAIADAYTPDGRYTRVYQHGTGVSVNPATRWAQIVGRGGVVLAETQP